MIGFSFITDYLRTRIKAPLNFLSDPDPDWVHLCRGLHSLIACFTCPG